MHRNERRVTRSTGAMDDLLLTAPKGQQRLPEHQAVQVNVNGDPLAGMVLAVHAAGGGALLLVAESFAGGSGLVHRAEGVFTEVAGLEGPAVTQFIHRFDQLTKMRFEESSSPATRNHTPVRVSAAEIQGLLPASLEQAA